MNIKEYEISVIIPTYNRGAILEKCLEALSSQSFPSDTFEVIVSDDGSEDDTRKKSNRFSESTDNRFRYIWQQNSGANAARNRAVLASKGRILLFINDDTIATKTLLEEHYCAQQLYPHENFAVLGRVTISPDVPYSIFAKLHLDANFGLWEGQTEIDWRAFYTCNVSVKKSFLMKYGLFEEKIRYHEDLELSERLSNHGLKVIYNPKALGYHFHFLSEKDYLDIAKREGKALFEWQNKSPHLKTKMAFVGYYLALPFKHRIKYLLADLLINRLTRPFLLVLARYSVTKNENFALFLYRKIYQSIKRETIRIEKDNSR